MTSFERLKKGKKNLAPLSQNTQSKKSKGNLENAADISDFAADLLEDIFGNSESKIVVEPNSKSLLDDAEHVDNSKFINLDDWDIVLSREVEEPTATTPSVKTDYVTPGKSLSKVNEDNLRKTPARASFTKEAPLTFSKKKEMMFSSREYEEDSTLKLRFLKRDVPAAKLKDLISSLDMCSLSSVSNWPTSKNWFTYGVVSTYAELKSGNGSRMDITDLAAEPCLVKVLLFGTAFREYFVKKVPVSGIVCLLNPTKGKPYEGKDTLVINNDSQLIVAGISRDFGLCGASKKGGGLCRAVVNMHLCRLCRFHAIQEYKKGKVSKDIKAAASGVGFGIKSTSTGLWNAPANRAQFLTPAKKNMSILKKDSDRLARLDTKSTKSVEPTCSKPLVKIDATELYEKRKSGSLESPVSNGACKRIALGNDSAKAGTSINFLNVSQTTVTSRVSAAKIKALNFARTNGGVITQTPKPKVFVERNGDENDEKKSNGITPEFLAMMASGSSNQALLAEAETEERNKRFERLRVIEEIGEKLVKTHEVPVRAIRCLECSKNFHQLPLQCVMNHHKCRVIMGTKRFFECSGCKGRTTTLERFPSAECGTCRAWNWKRTGMAAEKICSAVAPLSVRGLEETFIGTARSDGNLSMLVPEDKVKD